MIQFGGKDSKRHFTVVMGGKEHGLYVSSTPSSAAKKAVTKLCTANKSKKVEFSIREITQGSKKKTYGPYSGHIEKLKEPIELKGRVIMYKPVAKLSGKSGAKKGGMIGGAPKLSGSEAGPDTEKTNNNNSPIGEFLTFAYISWDAPEPRENIEQIDELYKKIAKLNQILKESETINFVNSDGNRNINGGMGKSSITIGFYNSKDIKYDKELPHLKEFFKYCVEAAKEGSYLKNFFHFDFSLAKPNGSFSPIYNNFLKKLAK